MWTPVTKEHPCPLCLKPDWCNGSLDEQVFQCGRTDKSSPPPGWRFSKFSADGRPIFHRIGERPSLAEIPAQRPSEVATLNKEEELRFREYLKKRGTVIPENVPITKTVYKYGQEQQIHRYDWPNPSKEKGRGKTFIQKHFDSQENKWAPGRGDRHWPAYNELAALEWAKNNFLLILEGEKCVDLAIDAGIQATTFAGSDWSEKSIRDLIQKAQKVGVQRIIYWGDGDPPGKEKAEKIQRIGGDYSIALDCITNRDLISDANDRDDIEEAFDHLGKEAVINFLQEVSSGGDPEQDGLSELIFQTQGEIGGNILPRGLEVPLRILAERMGLPVEPFVVTLLAVAASRIPKGARLLLSPATNHSIPPILWMGIVGESGSAKSPILKALVNPLVDLQDEAEQRYQRALRSFESELAAWESTPKNKRREKPAPPVPEDLFMTNFTMEALAQTLSPGDGPGLLIHVDELRLLFDSFDQYRGGKGGDRAAWLSLYDGGSFKSNRKTAGRVFVKRTAISVIGGIQPQTLETAWGRDDSLEDGLWSRFCWIRIRPSVAPWNPDGEKIDIDGLLSSLYSGLSRMPWERPYRLSREAKTLWGDWHHRMETAKVEEPSPLLRAAYPKNKDRASRIALVLHLTDAAMSGSPPGELIGEECLGRAIRLTDWLNAQTKALYIELGLKGSSSDSQVMRFVGRFRGQGWVDTRRTIQWWPARKDRPNAEKARDFMQQLVRWGYAQPNGQTGSKFAIRIPDPANKPTERDQSLVGQGFDLVGSPANKAPTLPTKDQHPSAKDNFVGTCWQTVGSPANKLEPLFSKDSGDHVGMLAMLEEENPLPIPEGWEVLEE